ncbi:Druantia anti-phage system protein DruA [uncultured Brevundimonas sp.]|uniref:Druantia anti-phage system protein DruA n=1 Tax=uncultured Brevundimonas sp. TaxID=213418 RepID=UPI0025DC49B8|nr:Druantia anti-phage system protein DruA [uncultured Brevundimonas sp.]
MSFDDRHFGPGRQRAFSPYLAPEERQQLHALLGVGAGMPPSFANELRALARRYIDDHDSLKLRAICLLVADLCEQGWKIELEADRITFEPPGISRTGELSVDDVKTRVRNTLQAARQRQLNEPSVSQFLRRMERTTGRIGTKPIQSLIDDGAELARLFQGIEALPADDRAIALKAIVDPVVEVCDANARCPDTGLRLIDIWRYFRHTWAHEYRSVPGRQMMVLVRNAARRNRPVMGIAMLASPVMRLKARDQWIGWLRDSAQERIATGVWDPAAFGQSLLDRIDASLKTIRWDDLASAREIAAPTEKVALRLEQAAAGAASAREKQLKHHYEQNRSVGGQVKPHKGVVRNAEPDTDWRAASEDLLFKRKRAEGLAQLLFAKRMFCGAGLATDPETGLIQLFETRSGQRALDIALAEFRKAGLSSEVADVSVCGAVHPYNEILGGKLVALMLTSAEIRDAYAARYGGQTSVIASQMAGRVIQKPADLKILTTTSLYGVGSSQYNRLVLRAADHASLSQDVRWGAIGESLTGGFGTLHLGGETAEALRTMALTRHDSRRVNNRFGEGTSPRLRQIREGLDALGLKSDAILHHATPRIFYGCELDPGARDALLGLAEINTSPPSVAAIAQAWRARWVDARIQRPETLAALATLGPQSVQTSLARRSEHQPDLLHQPT